MNLSVLTIDIPASKLEAIRTGLSNHEGGWDVHDTNYQSFLSEICLSQKNLDQYDIIAVGISSGFIEKKANSLNKLLSQNLTLKSKAICFLIDDPTFNQFESLPKAPFLHLLSEANGIGSFLSQVHQLSNQEQVSQGKSVVSLENLAKICHDLRSPLNVILGSVEILDQEIDLDLRLKHSRALKASSQMLLSLVENILELSQLRNNTFRLKTEKFLINNLFKELEDLCMPLATQKNIDLRFSQTPNTELSIEADLLRLKQVLLNLMYNAFKFTNEGTITIECKPNSVPGKIGNLLFHVKDSGHGIALEEQKLIFEPFRQAKSSKITNQEKSVKGTGLGLSICFDLIKKMGGEIWLESEIGKGSTFFFTIEAKAFTDSKHIQNSNIDEEPFSLLIVDDDPDTAESIAMVFEEKGVRCLIAHNAKLAMQYIEMEPIDAISTDYNMPGLDGADFVIKLRQQHIEIPLVILSGVLDGKLKKILELANVSVFSKPINIKKTYLPAVYKYLQIGAKMRAERRLFLDLFQLGSLRVLIVDDEPGQLICYQGFLMKAPFTIDCATSVSGAMELLGKEKYDLVLMDLNLADGTGIDLISHIRKHESINNLLSSSIIVISGSVQKNIIRRCFSEGADLHLVKPLKKADLWKAIVSLKSNSSNQNNPDFEFEAGIDKKFIEDLMELDKEKPEDRFFEKQIDSYLKRSEKFLGQLQKAISAKDKEKSIHASHKLTSICGFVGALNASQLSKKIEFQASCNNFKNCKSLLNALKKETKSNQVEIENILKEWNSNQSKKIKRIA